MRTISTGTRAVLIVATLVAGAVPRAAAQGLPPATPQAAQPASDSSEQDPMAGMNMDMSRSGWQFMQDGVVFGVFNHQGGPRGGTEGRAPNWWMGMASRTAGRSRITFTAMLSLDPATVGTQGYREIFQVGEVYEGKPLVDYQHPHDFFMQLAAVWRRSIGEHAGFTLAGGPAGEAALGPVAFMHRASAADNPFAPLSHHTFDSTHVGFGVVTAAVDSGRWVVEGSAFNGREPDEHRWDFDFGRLDSLSTRVWFKPRETWEFQVSSGRLQDPEALEPGVVIRTTGSASWFKPSGDDFTAVTGGYGVNATPHGDRGAGFLEGTWRKGRHSFFGRVELVQVETAVLINNDASVPISSSDAKDWVGAFTIGVVRDVFRGRGFEGGLGAALEFYGVPEALRETHGAHPVSFQIYFRLRLPTGDEARMWNMRMSQPMGGHSASMAGMSMDHAMP